jgi:hypothetical protein
MEQTLIRGRCIIEDENTFTLSQKDTQIDTLMVGTFYSAYKPNILKRLAYSSGNNAKASSAG